MNNFDNIYKENYPKMFCIAQKMIRDRDVVSDILQEVFIYYYQKSRNGHNIVSPQSWLIRATINKCIDHSSRNNKHVKIDAVKEHLQEENVAEKRLEEQVVNMALTRLKVKEKELAVLYSEGMSYREISEITGIKFESVGKMLSRTLKKLNKILKDLNYEMY